MAHPHHAYQPRDTEHTVLHAVIREHLEPFLREADRGDSHGLPDLKAREVDTSPRGAGTQRAWTWAALMRRVFALDVLACPRCGGPLRVIATIQDPLAVQAILAHLARTPAPEPPGPAPPTWPRLRSPPR